MKIRQGWNESGLCLSEYLQQGDRIDMELVDYFIGVLPPVTMTNEAIQIGEPYGTCEITGKYLYMTIEKVNGMWTYTGIKIKL